MPTKARPSRSITSKTPARASESAGHKSRGGKSDSPTYADAPPYKSLLQNLDRVVPHALALVIDTMPGAGLRILQPPGVHSAFFRSYDAKFQLEDKLTWATVIGGKTLVDGGTDAPAFRSSTYFRDFMRANGLERVVTAPVADPVFAGYPGALHVYRTDGQGAFTNAQVAAVTALARRLGDTAANVRSRRGRDLGQPPRWLHRPPVRQFAFDSRMNSLLWPDSLGTLDERLVGFMREEAARRIKIENDAGDAETQTVGLPDSAGELWRFRCVKYASYPALSNGPVVFFCMQPNFLDWEVVRASDFDADPEMVQLASALPYMRQHFARHPRLDAISKSVGISAFHFHRRFTRLMGITPKYFLLECQIYESRRYLAEGNIDLPQLSRECGFAHQSHFTSRFKQIIGMTPTRWRRYVRQADLAASK